MANPQGRPPACGIKREAGVYTVTGVPVKPKSPPEWLVCPGRHRARGETTFLFRMAISWISGTVEGTYGES